MKMDTLWEESLGHRLKVERNLNFSTISNEDDEFGFSRKKTARDPMSHRIIEKRRRDRMNNCLADLSCLVPTNYLKKGRGRIEKTEIIEMAIKHLKHLQAHPCKDPATCEVAKTTEQDHKRQYRLGFHECMSETVRFLVEIEGLYAGDGLCVRLVNHLQKHYDKVVGGMCYTQALGMMASEENKMMPMEIENTTSCFSTDNFTERGMPCDLNRSHHSLETKFSDETLVSDLKKEETLLNVNNTFPETSDDLENQSQCKPPSQLREMLQNPGLPKDRPRSATTAAHSPGHIVLTSASTNGHVIVEHHLPARSPKNEEVYKFKNNIKHRFNADLCHHTSSPTDSHSDQISLPDDERTHADGRSAPIIPNSEDHLSVPLLFPERHLNNPGLHQPTSPHMPNTELCIKIPERSVSESVVQPTAHPNNWDCHGETASSCGSNPSPPPAGRSNGSSSGYSTNGETNLGSKIKAQTPVQHSPALSPYSHTPDHLSNHSPSPQPIHQSAVGVPIFALHPKGTFYIPLTIDSNLVTPYLAGLDELAPVLHPVSICVNFSLCNSNKIDKLNGSTFHFRGHSLLMDRFNDRYLYGE